MRLHEVRTTVGSAPKKVLGASLLNVLFLTHLEDRLYEKLCEVR